MGRDEEDEEILEGGLWEGNGRSGGLIQVFSVRFTLVIVKAMLVFIWLQLEDMKKVNAVYDCFNDLFLLSLQCEESLRYQ